jgi:uncharacterized membrane protein YqhA
VTRQITLPEEDKPTLIEKLVLLVLRQTLGRVLKSAERFVKRTLRMIAMALAAVIIAVLGVGFLAVGAVKWFSILMPSWLAWTIVGLILLLVGVVLALGTLIGSRA